MDQTLNRFNLEEMQVHIFVLNRTLAGHVLTLPLRTVARALRP
jgi:hypothetical protein